MALPNYLHLARNSLATIEVPVSRDASHGGPKHLDNNCGRTLKPAWTSFPSHGKNCITSIVCECQKTAILQSPRTRKSMYTYHTVANAMPVSGYASRSSDVDRIHFVANQSCRHALARANNSPEWTPLATQRCFLHSQ